MTLNDILAAIDAGQTVLVALVELAGEVRTTLTQDDQIALDAALAKLQAGNDADFLRVDAKLRAAAP